MAHQNYSQQISDKGQLTTHPSQSSNASIYFGSVNKRIKQEKGAPNENIVQNHLNIALLNVF